MTLISAVLLEPRVGTEKLNSAVEKPIWLGGGKL